MTIESASVMSPAYIASMMPPSRVALPFTSFTPRRVRPHPPRSSKRPVDPWPSIVAPSLLLKTVLFTSDEHEIRLPSFMSAPGGKKMLTSLVASSTSKRRSCSLVAEKAPGMLGGIGGEGCGDGSDGGNGGNAGGSGGRGGNGEGGGEGGSGEGGDVGGDGGSGDGGDGGDDGAGAGGG